MPCHYQILPDDNLVVKTYFGRVTIRCVLKLLDDVVADPKYRDGMAELDDLSHIEDLDISATDISSLADMLIGTGARKRKPTRKAVIAPHGPGRCAAVGFTALVENKQKFQMGVFENYADAADFLGISDFAGVRRTVAVSVRIN